MCGLVGAISLRRRPVDHLETKLAVMGTLIRHRGPDGEGAWVSHDRHVGLGHRRLAIVDPRPAAAQPMLDHAHRRALTFNGEIYNYKELQRDLADSWTFRTNSDTEAILAAYDRYGSDCVDHLRGMFAFALWDEDRNRLFCARDRFGIKPFYYTVVDGIFYFASEAKALVPVLPDIETDTDALSEYFTFQFTIGEKTMFRQVRQLLPGHTIIIEHDELRVSRYWDIHYNIDYEHSEKYFTRKLTDLLEDSVDVHLRSDVPVGAYLSGGIDSSLMALLASREESFSKHLFNGRFVEPYGFDESRYARMAADRMQGDLHIVDITSSNFETHFEDVIYHLDFPTAGPGSFPQYMVSKLAAEHVKVVLGGQGGDEIFGGYARYLVAYFEQCIKASIDGTHRNGNFVVTIESIIPNLGLLREYKPMMVNFWRDGTFGPMDERYFRLVNRSDDMREEIDWSALNPAGVYESYLNIFNSARNVKKESYFDSMTHFDFKTLLPALLQVEDRMSMAHGLESRVPLLDHALIEFAATVPADVKFAGGQLKRLLKTAFADVLPKQIVERRDKMGFPVPLHAWFDNELNEMMSGIFETMRDAARPHVNGDKVLSGFRNTASFSRKSWALASLEIWHQKFHDRAGDFRAMLDGHVHQPNLTEGFGT